LSERDCGWSRRNDSSLVSTICSSSSAHDMKWPCELLKLGSGTPTAESSG
jgi:hypothetical protein